MVKHPAGCRPDTTPLIDGKMPMCREWTRFVSDCLSSEVFPVVSVYQCQVVSGRDCCFLMTGS